MIKKIVFSLFLGIFVFSFTFGYKSKSKEEVLKEIQNAQELIQKAQNIRTTEYSFYLGLARFFHKKAKEEFEDGERDKASYFATLAAINAQTAFYKMRTRSIKNSILQEELNTWKQIATENAGEMAKVYRKLEKEIQETKIKYAVMHAGFENQDNLQTIVLKDLDHFIKMNFAIRETGAGELADFIKFLALLPFQKIKIESHTSFPDKDNKESLARAEALKSFLVQNGLDAAKIEIEALSNTKPLMIKDAKGVEKPLAGPDNDRLMVFWQLNENKNFTFHWKVRDVLKKDKANWITNDKMRITLVEFVPFFNLLKINKVEIEGHTAKVDEERVSFAKATLLKDYLSQKCGIGLEKIVVKGLGNTKPLMIKDAKGVEKPLVGPDNDRTVFIFYTEDNKTVSLTFRDREIIQPSNFSIRLSDEGKKHILELIKMIQTEGIKNTRVTIEGHSFKPDTALKESEIKANLVKEFMAQNGIDAQLINSYGLSNKKPLKVNGVVAKGLENDRVEVSFSVGKKFVLTISDDNLLVKKSFLISDTGKGILDKVFYLFSLVPKARVLIEGHTATPDKDNATSLAKANATKDYLVNVKRVPTNNIFVSAYGNTRMIEVNGIVKPGPQNDRVVIIIELPKEE